MADDCLLSISLDGETRLLSASDGMTFANFEEKIVSMWNSLEAEQISFRYSVYTITNCVLASDSDFINMLDACKSTSQPFVSITVNRVIPRDGVGPESRKNSVRYDFNDYCLAPIAPSIHSSSQSSSHTHNLQGPAFHSGDVAPVLKQSKIPYRSVKKRFFQSEEQEFSGDGTLPTFHTCPDIDKKDLLSDSWKHIMDGGIGSIFTGGAQGFRSSLIKFATIMGFRFKYVRNNVEYIYVVCHDMLGGGCGWFIKARCIKLSMHFQIYKGHFIHSCLGLSLYHNKKRFGPKIIGQLVDDDVKANPSLGGAYIVDTLRVNYGLEIPYYKAWRTSEEIRNNLFGSYQESYHQLRWYTDAVKSTNPGSIVDLEIHEQSNIFQRVFIAFKACIDGFKSCRPMLFLDGTFMYGRARGVLLTATAKDDNNGLYPIALAVVDAENINNWAWFLSKLRHVITHEEEILYISDRNLGLMAALQPVFERPRHFFCLFHLLGNLRGRFAGRAHKFNRGRITQLFKECAYAHNIPLFEEKIHIFREMGGRIAVEWLTDLPYEKWAVAHSPDIKRYGEMTSNTAESFNKWIKEGRGLPITHMIDFIRSDVSRLHFERSSESALWTTVLCPRKDKLWNEQNERSRSWKVHQRSDCLFEVEAVPSVVVDLTQRTCTCSRWQLTGFPCWHATAVIMRHGSSITSYVSKYFLSVTYRKCYMHYINPIPETERFASTDQQIPNEAKILPPAFKVQPGRPRKSRIRSYGEFTNKK